MLSNRPAVPTRVRHPIALWGLLLSIFGWIVGADMARANDDTPTTKVEYEYEPPGTAGDTLSLSFFVPPQHRAAILVMKHTDAAVPAVEDYQGSLILELPIEPVSGYGSFVATLPENLNIADLAAADLDLRILVGDPATLAIFISSPIAVVPSNDDPQEEEEESQSSFFVGSVFGTDDEEPVAATASSGASNSTSGGLDSNNGKQKSSLTLTFLDNVPVYLRIHDQPTPIQGSGH